MSAQKSKPKSRRGHKRNNSNFQLTSSPPKQPPLAHPHIQQYIHSQTAKLIELSKAKTRNVVVIERLDDEHKSSPCGRLFQFGRRMRDGGKENTFLEQIPEAPDSSNKKDHKFDSLMTTANSRENRRLGEKSRFVNDSLLIAKCPRVRESKSKIQSAKQIPKRISEGKSAKKLRKEEQLAPNIIICSGSASKNPVKKPDLKRPQSLKKILKGIQKHLTRLNSRSNMIAQQNRHLQEQVRQITQKQSLGTKLAEQMQQQLDQIRQICNQNRNSLASIENYYTGNSEAQSKLRHSEIW